MATFQDGSKLAAAQRANLKKFKEYGRTEHGKMVSDLYEGDFANLSGKVKTATQRAVGHPYGRGVTKSGNPGRQRKVKTSVGTLRLPAMPINTQTGKLRQSLKVQRKSDDSGQTLKVSVGQGLRYAKYILSPDGTKKMVTRPFFADQQKRWRKANLELLKKARAYQQPS